MYKTVICVVYVDDCLFWICSQYDIDNAMEYFMEDAPSCNWEHSKGESVSDFLGIDIKKFNDVGIQFCQTGLIHKFLEVTRMDHCNRLNTPTKVEEYLATYENGSEAKRDWANSYASVIGMILFLE